MDGERQGISHKTLEKADVIRSDAKAVKEVINLRNIYVFRVHGIHLYSGLFSGLSDHFHQMLLGY